MRCAKIICPKLQSPAREMPVLLSERVWLWVQRDFVLGMMCWADVSPPTPTRVRFWAKSPRWEWERNFLGKDSGRGMTAARTQPRTGSYSGNSQGGHGLRALLGLIERKWANAPDPSWGWDRRRAPTVPGQRRGPGPQSSPGSAGRAPAVPGGCGDGDR